jgi:hypothetical protein
MNIGAALTTVSPTAPPVPVLGETPVDIDFADSVRKARYGVAYLRTICAQAGVGFSATEADEDTMAIDAEIRFPAMSSRVQIKCTSQFKLSGRSATMTLDPEWVRKWKASHVPVYFVIVVVPAVIPDWINHSNASTTHKTAAYWTRFDPATDIDRIKVPKNQRFTLATLHEWKTDLDDMIGLGGAS